MQLCPTVTNSKSNSDKLNFSNTNTKSKSCLLNFTNTKTNRPEQDFINANASLLKSNTNSNTSYLKKTNTNTRFNIIGRLCRAWYYTPFVDAITAFLC